MENFTKYFVRFILQHITIKYKYIRAFYKNSLQIHILSINQANTISIIKKLVKFLIVLYVKLSKFNKLF